MAVSGSPDAEVLGYQLARMGGMGLSLEIITTVSSTCTGMTHGHRQEESERVWWTDWT